MTIATTTSRVDYLGDGGSTAFPVPFPFFDATELRVIRRVIATGEETVLVLGIDYGVSGGGGLVGTVTAVSAPPSSQQWTILRATRRTQPVAYPTNGPFPAATHERALDRVTALVQENERDASRSLRVAETDPSGELTLPTSVERALRVLGFDASGNPIPVVPDSGGVVITPFSEILLAAISAAVARATLGAAHEGGAATFTSINGGGLAGLRNLLINGSFRVNQLGLSGSIVLSAGQYGHDCWKAGASGCSYTIATVAGVTTITISAGSLVQVVEDQNNLGGAMALSWGGTAQGKFLGGTYAASPVLAGAITGGSSIGVEFGTGTLSRPQLEPGGLATPFEQRPLGLEIALCQRYFWVGNARCSGTSQAASTALSESWIAFPVLMRVTPTLSVSNLVISATTAGADADQPSPNGFRFYVQGNATVNDYSASALVAASARL